MPTPTKMPTPMPIQDDEARAHADADCCGAQPNQQADAATHAAARQQITAESIGTEGMQCACRIGLHRRKQRGREVLRLVARDAGIASRKQAPSTAKHAQDHHDGQESRTDPHGQRRRSALRGLDFAGR